VRKYGSNAPVNSTGSVKRVRASWFWPN